MKLGMVGLGRMGGNMTVRLQQHGHQVVAYDPSPDAVEAAVVVGRGGRDVSRRTLFEAARRPRSCG